MPQKKSSFAIWRFLRKSPLISYQYSKNTSGNETKDQNTTFTMQYII